MPFVTANFRTTGKLRKLKVLKGGKGFALAMFCCLCLTTVDGLF